LSVHIANANFKNGYRVLVLNGSPKSDSFTWQLAERFLKAARQAASIKIYNAYDIAANACVDCGYCKSNRACKFSDLNEFYSDFESFDLIVFSTPVYNLSFPAPLKAIIDRLQLYYNARFSRGEKPAIAKKRKAVIISTCGGSDDAGFKIIEKQLKAAFTVLNIELAGTVFKTCTDNEKIGEEDLQKASKLALTIFE
jgi:multimeric flavodoxin WrbA